MSNDKTQEIEEQKVKEEAEDKENLHEQSDSEVRESIVKELELDDDIDTDLLDKLVEKEQASSKKFGVVIRQKIKKQEKIDELSVEPKKEETPQPEPKTEEPSVDDAVNKALEKRDLDDLTISDELKEQVKVYADMNKVSVKQAFESDYIKFRKKEEDDKVQEEDASISGKHKTQTSRDFSEMTPNDFDLDTPEGRKEYKDWKVWNQKNNA